MANSLSLLRPARRVLERWIPRKLRWSLLLILFLLCLIGMSDLTFDKSNLSDEKTRQIVSDSQAGALRNGGQDRGLRSQGLPRLVRAPPRKRPASGNEIRSTWPLECPYTQAIGEGHLFGLHRRLPPTDDDLSFLVDPDLRLDEDRSETGDPPLLITLISPLLYSMRMGLVSCKEKFIPSLDQEVCDMLQLLHKALLHTFQVWMKAQEDLNDRPYGDVYLNFEIFSDYHDMLKKYQQGRQAEVCILSDSVSHIFRSHPACVQG